jgi:hypothetical protein
MDIQPLFSHDEATALLPMVREVFTRVRPLVDQMKRDAVTVLEAGVAGGGMQTVDGGTISTDLGIQRERLTVTAKSVEAELSRLAELGIEVKSLEGLVDFRSRHHGRIVQLCWQWDEPAIEWWHELQDGFAGRQKIEDASLFLGDERQ